jgi:O-succinylbenzoic acid--CoA ligase
MQYSKIHKKFQLHDTSFTDVRSLLDYVTSFSEESASFLKEWFDETYFVEVQTSGSTGVPKKIILKKEQLFNSAMATGSYFQLKENTTALLCLSSYYIAGKMMWVRALTLGWHLDVVPTDSNPMENSYKTYDFTAMVPLQVANSLDQLFRVKKIIIGGGVVSEELKEKLQEISTQAFATYGMTETITHVAVKRLNSFKKEKTSCYEVLPSIKITIDSRGCLVIEAPLLSDQKIVTNDLVDLLSETQFQWLGRFDAIINSGGVKLIPELIEKKIRNVISEKFFVAGKSDAFLGEKLILIIEGTHTNITEKKAILSFLKEVVLEPYEIPKEIYFVKEFLMTDTGKIKRLLILENLN